MKSIFVFVILVLVTAAKCSKSVVYLDNGLHQTSIDHEMSEIEKEEVEIEILNLLGVPNRPKKIQRSAENAAPRFLMDVYKTLMEEQEDEEERIRRNADFNFSGEEQNAIDQSDVIMTFEAIEHHGSGIRHERGQRLWFDIQKMPKAENILGAELRMYQKSTTLGKIFSNTYTVIVYELVKIDSGERELEFVSAVNTTGNSDGWFSFNVTSSMCSWVNFPEMNKGLYVSVHPVNRPEREINPQEIGLVTTKDDDGNQPFLVAFLQAINSNHIHTKRSPKVHRTKRSFYSKYTEYSTMMQDQSHDISRPCRKHSFYFSFKDIGWQDWIIHPKVYGANYCAGQCDFPLNAHMNATNHAIVQTLVHLIYPLTYPTPCCAPKRLAPIAMLYYLDDDNAVLKKYKRMIVKTCGCH